MGITRDDWLRALDEAGCATVDDQGAMTAQEFAEMIGVDRQAAGRRLRMLEKAGKATRTTKRAKASDGRYYISPAYKLVEPKKKRR